MEPESARLRKIKAAAIAHFGLDGKEDEEWLNSAAERFADYPIVDALGLIEEHLVDYRIGERKRSKEPGHRPSSQRGSSAEGAAPLKPIPDLVKPDDDTAQRIVAFSKYLARIASVDKNVLRYRKNNLGGFMETITEQEAEKRPDHPALLQVCRHLTKHYPWTHDEARYFVLCGAVPQAVKVMGKVHKTWDAPQGVAAHKYNRQTIHMEIPAWLPSDQVRKAYLILQRQAHGGRESRRPKERNVALFEFVLEKAKVNLVSGSEYLARLEILEKEATLEKKVTWSKLMGDWNKLYEPGHPWHYREVSNFRRDFARGQHAVTGTKYALSGIPGEPKTAADAEARFERMLDRFRRPGAALVEATDEEIS
jgi:hypothetical protein